MKKKENDSLFARDEEKENDSVFVRDVENELRMSPEKSPLHQNNQSPSALETTNTTTDVSTIFSDITNTTETTISNAIVTDTNDTTEATIIKRSNRHE